MQELKDKVNFIWRFKSMGEMVKAVEKEVQETE
jgi:hypothetical protein